MTTHRLSAPPVPRVADSPSTTAGLRAPLLVSTALVVVGALGAAGTFFLPDLQRGTPVMEGSARGTALVLLVLALPTLLAAAVLAGRGSARAAVVWLGATGYVAYNTLLFLLAMPFNALFLVYEAMLTLSLATLGLLVARLPFTRLARALRAAPARPLAAYLSVTAGLNALVWLGAVVPELGTRGTPQFLVGSGLATNPVYIFDLAVWLPLSAFSAWLLWRRAAAGYVLGGGFLVMWLLEAVGVATDQWFGSRADPDAVIATMGGVYLFAGVAVVATVAVTALLRSVDDDLPPHQR